MSAGDHDGCSSRSTAAAPATCGAANDVPLTTVCPTSHLRDDKRLARRGIIPASAPCVLRPARENWISSRASGDESWHPL